MQMKTHLATAVTIAGLAAGAALGWSAPAGAQSVPVNPNPAPVATPVTPPAPPVAPPPQSPIEAPALPGGAPAGVNASPNGLPSTGAGAVAAQPDGALGVVAFAALGLALAGAGLAVRRKIHNA